MKILEVRPCRGHQVTVLTDEHTQFVIDKRTWQESPYGVDSFLSCEDMDALCALSDRNRAKEKAVFLLSKRDYSKKELAHKLCREKGKYYADRTESAAQAAAYMEELGYVNDERYARRLARQYQTERLYSRRHILEKLCQKGISRELARQAADELETEEAQVALEFLYRKRYTVPVTREETDKTAAALARQGFSGDDIRRALAQFKEEVSNGD